jgi:CDP-diacylglycerol--glycerol-3-phosphate 3-phosphatidyltransferase
LKARKRILLSSLYLGTGQNEKQIISNLDKALSENSDLTVTILIDYLRGTRGSSNSLTMFAPLTKYPNFRAFYFQSPNFTWWKKMILPERLNEIVGVQHIKAYIFDDDILMSGANLSDWYFIDRQDRYILFRNESNLVDYFSNLIQILTKVSHFQTLSGLIEPKIEGDFVSYANELLSKSINPMKRSDQVSDTWIIPTIQMGQLNIHVDQDITEHLLQKDNLRIIMSSAYFNLPDPYIKIIESKNDEVDIITSCPKANGFYGSNGLSEYIPLLYSYKEECFFAKTIEKKKMRILEYNRDKWTYHAKGLWIHEQGDEYPCISMIGSPNFGHRSLSTDTEAQMLIMTENPDLKRKLFKEYDRLLRDSYQVKRSHFNEAERQPNFILKIASKLLSKYI